VITAASIAATQILVPEPRIFKIDSL
jgi:hypothetical protein